MERGTHDGKGFRRLDGKALARCRQRTLSSAAWNLYYRRHVDIDQIAEILSLPDAGEARRLVIARQLEVEEREARRAAKAAAGTGQDTEDRPEGRGGTYRNKENHMEREDNRHGMEEDVRETREHGTLPLGPMLIVAAVVAFLIGVFTMAVVSAYAFDDAGHREDTYWNAIVSEYDSIGMELEDAVMLRNEQAAELERLEDEIRMGLFRYEKAAEYLAIQDMRIDRLKRMGSSTAERIEAENGGYTSLQTLGYTN